MKDKEIIEDLGIDLDNIKHLVVSGGAEIVCEIIGEVSEDGNKYIIAFPLKIVRDTVTTETGYEAHQFFIELNPCAELSSLSLLNKDLILLESSPNVETIEAYLSSLDRVFFPMDVELIEDGYEDIKLEKKSTNVIDFPV